ncbi:MAG: class I SAM-dependent methyltransferase [Candidatus Hodarchaeota archaeon]
MKRHLKKKEIETQKYFTEQDTVFSWWDPENPKMKNGYSNKDRILFKKERDIILDYLKISNAETILDVGSGRGRISLSIAKQHPKSRVIGIDLSPQMVEYSKNLAAEKKIENVEFIIGDGLSLEFKENLFDITICIQVLMHIPEPDLFLSELKRVTKEYGIIIIDQINSNHSWRTKLRGKKNRILVPIKEFIAHKFLRKTPIVYRMKEKEYKWLIERNQLSIEKYLTLSIESVKPVYFLAFCKNISA